MAQIHSYSPTQVYKLFISRGLVEGNHSVLTLNTDGEEGWDETLGAADENGVVASLFSLNVIQL